MSASGLTRRRSATVRGRWTPTSDGRGTSGGRGAVSHRGGEGCGGGLAGRGGRGSPYRHSWRVCSCVSAIGARGPDDSCIPFVCVLLLGWSLLFLWGAPEMAAAAALLRLPQVCCSDAQHSYIFQRPACPASPPFAALQLVANGQVGKSLESSCLSGNHGKRPHLRK